MLIQRHLFKLTRLFYKLKNYHRHNYSRPHLYSLQKSWWANRNLFSYLHLDLLFINRFWSGNDCSKLLRASKYFFTNVQLNPSVCSLLSPYSHIDLIWYWILHCLLWKFVRYENLFFRSLSVAPIRTISNPLSAFTLNLYTTLFVKQLSPKGRFCLLQQLQEVVSNYHQYSISWCGTFSLVKAWSSCSKNNYNGKSAIVFI